jgi:hypothetical protein
METAINRFVEVYPMFRYRLCLPLWMILCSSSCLCAQTQHEHVLANKRLSLTANLQTLQMSVRPHDSSTIELSRAQHGFGKVTGVRKSKKGIRWNLDEKALSLELSLEGNELAFEGTAKEASSFTWPVARMNAPIKALILPRAAGIYVPLDNSRWTEYLAGQDAWNTLEQLSMPFWGLDCNGSCLTWIVTNPYNNSLNFKQRDNSLQMDLTHAFTRFNRAMTFGFRIVLSKTGSPVEPARQFRRYLNEQRQVVSLQQKARLVPRVNRLQGAAHVYLWGDGVSLAMLKRFQEADLNRLRLCVAGWEGVEKRPGVARKADELGYLFGTYDSFHSIHDPALIGTDRSWSTAQFGQALYDSGRILKSDGTPWGGFKGVGAKLSPIAARPYVEQRVRHNMQNVPYSYYFVDCDAFGEYYDDYTAGRPIGQADDAQARIDRLQWISNTFQVPVGSEGGCHLFAPTIHVSEGIFGPGFGWGDPDHKNRQSPYYLGGYWPPEGPAVFVKQVPMKETYQFFHYDPRFHLPLYEIVYHDSVITTHSWGNGSLKFNNMLDTVELTELLYLVPPLYHLNLDEFAKHKESIVRHYAVFSPLHRQFGFAQMTDFRWLTEDRLVQCTKFGKHIEIVANFSPAPYTHRSHAIPGRSILSYNEDTGETKTFTPQAHGQDCLSHARTQALHANSANLRPLMPERG